jgi:hypothetical protein
MELPGGHESMHEQFWQAGFVGPINVLTRDEVDALRSAIDTIIADIDRLAPQLYEVEQAWPEDPARVVCHFLGGFRVHPLLAQLVRDPRLTAPCANLLGLARLRLWHDQVFAKPPQHPGIVPWHQDYSYWTRTGPACHITANLLLDDSDEESGCLRFVAGSHRWNLLPPVDFDAEMDAVLEHLAPDAQLTPTAVPVRAGQATIHHSHTLHSSGPNRSDRPRRAVVVNYMGADVRVQDGSRPLLKGTPLQAEGQVVSGPDFPVVWPEPESR